MKTLKCQEMCMDTSWFSSQQDPFNKIETPCSTKMTIMLVRLKFKFISALDNSIILAHRVSRYECPRIGYIAHCHLHSIGNKCSLSSTQQIHRYSHISLRGFTSLLLCGAVNINRLNNGKFNRSSDVGYVLCGFNV